ncbi:MAG: glutathione peroxidase [Pirellulaceae bacterium]
MVSIAAAWAVPSRAAEETGAALKFSMRNIDGKETNLGDYQGKVVMVVNTASKCGLTPQYKELQELYQTYADQGFVILGFPCNQFRGQEPADEKEIKSFCTENYGVTFDMFSKVEVNGDQACDLYKYLKSVSAEPVGTGDISWNFEKFLIDRHGNVVARFAPRTKPDAAEVTSKIESELQRK